MLRRAIAGDQQLIDILARVKAGERGNLHELLRLDLRQHELAEGRSLGLLHVDVGHHLDVRHHQVEELWIGGRQHAGEKGRKGRGGCD